jgi:hypothetical protein
MYKIICNNKGTNQFSIYIDGDYKNEIYESIIKTRIIQTCFYDVDNNCLILNAENVITLSKYLEKQYDNKLNEKQCINIIENLTRQIKYLELTNYGFYGFDLDDVLVIDNNKFIIANGKYLLPIEKNNLIFNELFNKPYFNNPEIQNISSLPAKIHFKSCYYSLGCLITYLLLKTYLLVGNEKEIDKILFSLNYTKIYWFLNRCLLNDYNKRTLLLV